METSKKDEFISWVEDTIENIVDMFIEKYDCYYEEHITECMAKTPNFKEWYLETILRDTAAVTGCELIRRIVGLANVKDITSIVDEEKRAKAEKLCIYAGKDFILNRKQFKTGKDFMNALKRAEEKVK